MHTIAALSRLTNPDYHPRTRFCSRDALIQPTTTPAPDRSKGRGWAFRLLQVVVLVAAGIDLVRVTAPHWPAVRARDLAWQLGPLALSGGLILLSLGVMIWTWTVSLRWCAVQLRFRDAARIWFTANLARFIPGTVWQFASLATMSLRYGVSPVAATATALLQMLALLITALLVMAGFMPAVRHAAWWQTTLVAAAVLVGVGLVLTRPGGRLGAWLEHRVPSLRLLWSGLTPLRMGGFLLALVIPWLLYGTAFYLLAQGLLGTPPGGWSFYVAAFTGGYIAGIIAVFAPAGLLVREAALVALLSPLLSNSDAVILAAASRIWLTALELVAGAAVLALPSPQDPG